MKAGSDPTAVCVNGLLGGFCHPAHPGYTSILDRDVRPKRSQPCTVDDFSAAHYQIPGHGSSPLGFGQPAASFRGSVKVTVPVAWSPKSFAARIATEMTPSFSSDVDAMTSPVNRRTLLGTAGAPRRIEICSQDGFGASPVRDEASHVSVGGEDIHKNVRCVLGDGVIAVMVDWHEVTRCDGAGDDNGGGDIKIEAREFLSYADLVKGQRLVSLTAHDVPAPPRQL